MNQSSSKFFFRKLVRFRGVHPAAYALVADSLASKVILHGVTFQFTCHCQTGPMIARRCIPALRLTCAKSTLWFVQLIRLVVSVRSRHETNESRAPCHHRTRHMTTPRPQRPPDSTLEQPHNQPTVRKHWATRALLKQLLSGNMAPIKSIRCRVAMGHAVHWTTTKRETPTSRPCILLPTASRHFSKRTRPAFCQR